MRAKLRQWLGNAVLALGALAVVSAFVEFVVFGMILKPDDVLPNVSINGVVRYQPGSIAVFRHPDGRASTVTVNADGWNSTLPRYVKERTPGRLRIAVIGDSYVHASYVDTDKAFAEVIARRLKEDGRDAEVLRFGMDGAPLSQHLHVLRREVAAYQPDLVLVQLIHNDFDESYRFLKTRYASSFLKVDVDAEGRAREFAPVDFKPSSADLLRSSATFRYLYYETNLYLLAKSWVSRYFWGGEADYDPAHIVSGVDTRNLDDPARMARIAAYVVAEMKKLADAQGFRLALSIDAVRETIYGRDDAATRKVQHLNQIAADAANAAAVPLLDLTEVLRSDFAGNGRRLEYTYDWHWNARTNDLVGRTLADWIASDPRLLGAAPTAPTLGRADAPDDRRG